MSRLGACKPQGERGDIAISTYRLATLNVNGCSFITRLLKVIMITSRDGIAVMCVQETGFGELSVQRCEDELRRRNIGVWSSHRESVGVMILTDRTLGVDFCYGDYLVQRLGNGVWPLY